MTAVLDRFSDVPTQPEVPTTAQVLRMHERPRYLDSTDLVALPSAITVARLFVADTLRRWRATLVEPDMETVAARLVALAVEETGPGDTNWSEIHLLGTLQIFQAVSNSDPGGPRPHDRWRKWGGRVGM